MNNYPTVAGFPITHDIVLKKKGEHDGIYFEVSNHARDRDGREDKGTWCYYVSISEKMLPADLFEEFWLMPEFDEKGRAAYPYYSAKFASVDWHCGVTYYEKLGGIDNQPRYVKIGCDYAHYWDEGLSFDLDDVIQDAINTIKQLSTMYPFYVRCPYNGSYSPREEMVEHKGRLWSKKGIADDLAWEAARKAKT